MSEALGAPQAATVIAINLHARGDLARRRFTELLSSTLAHSCPLQAASNTSGEIAFTAIIPDGTQVLSLLRRLISIQADFSKTYPDCAARFLVHHGFIFLAGDHFIGAALRSAHSRLLRLPANIPLAATSDFSDYVDTWANKPIIFSSLPGESDSTNLLSLSFPSLPLPETIISQAHDEAFLQHLTTCLAAHIGPFAEILVDAAKRSSATPAQLIEELASEINTPKAREKFLVNARNFSFSNPG